MRNFFFFVDISSFLFYFFVYIVTRSTVHIQSSSEFHLHFSSFWCWTNNIKTSLLISVRCLHPSKIIVVVVVVRIKFSANKNDEITIIKLISLISNKNQKNLPRIPNLWDEISFSFICFLFLSVAFMCKLFVIQIFFKDKMIYVIYIHIMKVWNDKRIERSKSHLKLNEFEK